MLLRRFGLTGLKYLSRAADAGLVCCVLLGGIADAQAPQQGAPAAAPVVIYNMFSRSIAQYRALYADTSVEILTMVSRNLVQRYPAAAPAAE
jgi:hypothetical protein